MFSYFSNTIGTFSEQATPVASISSENDDSVLVERPPIQDSKCSLEPPAEPILPSPIEEIDLNCCIMLKDGKLFVKRNTSLPESDSDFDSEDDQDLVLFDENNPGHLSKKVIQLDDGKMYVFA